MATLSKQAIVAIIPRLCIAIDMVDDIDYERDRKIYFTYTNKILKSSSVEKLLSQFKFWYKKIQTSKNMLGIEPKKNLKLKRFCFKRYGKKKWDPKTS